jgi:iron(III) transport system ATP-binding protein
MAALEISRLAKAFGSAPGPAAAVLQDVSFSVESGALMAILGASGSGKTTLLRLIAGFERPDSGEIRLGGEIFASAQKFKRPEARGIGYVAQEGALFPHLSVADNITFGLSRAQRRARHRVAELLEMVDLPAAYADRPPQALSGGEQQRVALARALAPGPLLVLLDEPFSALDAALRAETRRAVASALKAAGATAILVTHDQAEALSMGAVVGVLQEGKLAQLSAPETLYWRPASPGVANFVGDAVFCQGHAAAGRVRCALGDLPLAGGPEGAVSVMVRPEQIKILDMAGDAAAAHAAAGGVAAVVAHVTFYGHDAVVGLRVPGAPAVTARVFSHAVPKPGSAVFLRVEGEVAAYPAG